MDLFERRKVAGFATTGASSMVTSADMDGPPDTWAGSRAATRVRARRSRKARASRLNRSRLAAFGGVALFSLAVWAVVIWGLIRIL
jgi:hypothetical protein